MNKKINIITYLIKNFIGVIYWNYRIYFSLIIFIYFRSTSPVEVPSLCRQLQQNYKNNEGEGKKNISEGSRKLRPRSLRERSKRECNQLFNWKLECKKFLQMMWLSKDSTPFR